MSMHLKNAAIKKQHFDKQALSIALVALVIGITLGAVFHKETIIVREGTANTPAAMTSVNLMIDYGNGTIKTWNTVSWHEAMSIQNLLETIAGAKGIVFLSKDISGKSTVESIDGIANDSKTNMRWQYWVNNNYEPRIASKYYLKPGDMVMWKYVKEQNK